MIQLHIESKKKPKIYRKLLLPEESRFDLLDELLLLSFDLDDAEYVNFEMVKKKMDKCLRIKKKNIIFT